MRSEPTRLPGLPGVSLRLRYAGYSDFQSNDERKGEIDLAASLEGRFLPRDCSIGTNTDPIHSVLQQPGLTEVVPLLDHRLGLPAPSGGSVLEQRTYVGIRPYAVKPSTSEATTGAA
ncbi:hypothetical protein [Prauserella flavalba]|uniref:Uncharacterized protein n=1 Tax=Prauserella flavalba TaxID=1477506 RepID=A0A318LVK5_9PSEU|nr:hypothetical protein [Prauserella flavalba]PXY38557.1 hypothetical protein BA062_02120 [Prauserella flavalba]